MFLDLMMIVKCYSFPNDIFMNVDEIIINQLNQLNQFFLFDESCFWILIFSDSFLGLI